MDDIEIRDMQFEKINELETENKRLRQSLTKIGSEALDIYLNEPSEQWPGLLSKLFAETKTALADEQKGGVCPVCASPFKSQIFYTSKGVKCTHKYHSS